MADRDETMQGRPKTAREAALVELFGDALDLFDRSETLQESARRLLQDQSAAADSSAQAIRQAGEAAARSLDEASGRARRDLEQAMLELTKDARGLAGEIKGAARVVNEAHARFMRQALLMGLLGGAFATAAIGLIVVLAFR